MNTPTTISAGTTTSPFLVNPDGWIVITPSAGATVTVQYTTGTPADIAGGGATWVTQGTYSVNTALRVEEDLTSLHFKLTATTASVNYSVEGELGQADRATLRSYTKTIVNPLGAAYATDSDGNVTGLVGPGGERVKLLQDRVTNGALVCDWGSAGALSTTGSTGTGFAFALDTAVTLNGKPTVKCTFQSDATSQTFTGIWTPTNPIRLRDVRVIHVPLMYTSSNNAGGVGNPFQVWLQTSSGKSIRLQLSWANSTANPALAAALTWHTYSFTRGAAAITGTGSFTDLDTANETITSVRILTVTTGATANSNPVWVGEIRADVKRYPGYVSITMDGEYTTQYTVIHQALAAAKLRASFAITNSDIGGTGRMTAAQLDEMNEYGHEMIHHTYDATKTNGYVNATDWPTSLTISEDVRAQWNYFRGRGWTRGIGFGVWGFAYTFESAQTQARQNLVKAGLLNGGLTAIRKSVNYNEINKHLPCCAKLPIDPLVVPGAIQVTNTHTVADLKAAVDAAEANGQWAILTFHKTADSPGSLETTEAIFDEFVEYLAARVAGGGVVCLPFGEAYSAIYGDKF